MEKLTTLYVWVTEDGEPRREVVAGVGLPHASTQQLIYSNASSHEFRQQCDDFAVRAAERFNAPMRLVRFDRAIDVKNYPAQCSHPAIDSGQHCTTCGAEVLAQASGK